jgi:selenide,water dikinase
MPDEGNMPSPRLTELAHGGGCGCKLSPAVLRDILRDMPAVAGRFPDLLVGTETGDDAAVYRVTPDRAVIATTDFFMPIVDDPRDFGRIAATNALSDVYAMGGTPILALAVVGMPVGTLPPATIRAILAGGAEACAGAGIPVAGGHSIDSPEPIYGLVALGLVDPARVLRNSGAQAGDALILTKPLGVGVYSAAMRRGALPPALYDAMIASTTKLNTLGARLGAIAGVHAVTDVTGFALLGHALEMAEGAGLTATLHAGAVPLLPDVAAMARDGFVTGAGARNWNSYADRVTLPADLPDWTRALLCDPQTSGGLLIAAAPDAVADVLRAAHEDGLAQACVIGAMAAGAPSVVVAQD